MALHGLSGTAVLALGSLVFLGMAGNVQTEESPARFQTSCFAVMGTVACIDGGFMPVAPGAPFVTTGIGPDGVGENEDMTIRDDGGREVSRG